jgi:hypothetical protein
MVCVRERAQTHTMMAFASLALICAMSHSTPDERDADFCIYNNALLVSSKQTEAEIARQQEEYANILREQANLLADGLLLKHDNPLANFVLLPI